MEGGTGERTGWTDESGTAAAAAAAARLLFPLSLFSLRLYRSLFPPLSLSLALLHSFSVTGHGLGCFK